jgi:hypothetical protein
MKFNSGRLVLVAFLVAGGCAGPTEPGGSVGGQGGGTGGSGGGASGGRGGGTGGGGARGAATGGAAAGGAGGAAVGGTGGSASGGAGGGATGGSPGAGGGSGGGADAGADSNATGSDGGGTAVDSQAPADMGMINLEGSIPPYEGPPVGPEVKMDCPDDPTAGFTEYKDTFRVEHPYDLPVTDRFSIDGGIYTYWVRQGDKRHNPTSTARNPRTEARYSQNFRTGVRMFSADVFWERSVNNGTIVMQVHTTTTGIGPVYMVAEGANVSPISGARVPGGLFDRWINLKVEINAATTGSRYWVNNCLVATKGSGTRGDGNNYFKLGVYHCDAGTCRARAKNIKLYMK